MTYLTVAFVICESFGFSPQTISVSYKTWEKAIIQEERFESENFFGTDCRVTAWITTEDPLGENEE